MVYYGCWRKWVNASDVLGVVNIGWELPTSIHSFKNKTLILFTHSFFPIFFCVALTPLLSFSNSTNPNNFSPSPSQFRESSLPLPLKPLPVFLSISNSPPLFSLCLSNRWPTSLFSLRLSNCRPTTTSLQSIR